MEIVNRKRHNIQIKATHLGYIFNAMICAVNRRDIVDAMFHITLAPILGRWKVELRKDLWKLS